MGNFKSPLLGFPTLFPEGSASPTLPWLWVQVLSERGFAERRAAMGQERGTIDGRRRPRWELQQGQKLLCLVCGGSSCCSELPPLQSQERFLFRAEALWEREALILLTVIISSIFRLHVANGESKICARPTATEAGRHSRFQIGSIIDEEPWGLARFLLVPI